MATAFTGGCLCGAVRYECSADALFMGNCHCRDCQKAVAVRTSHASDCRPLH
ncbi:MAG: hypothetical protein ACM3TN_05890 [Alphaproteobacteria bacterium]